MPTNRTRRRQARRAAYPGWLLEALRSGHADYSTDLALWALRHGRTSVVAGRNREPDGRLDVAVVVTIWREFGGMLLADHIETHPATRPVPWWWWDSGLAIKPGTPIKEIEAAVGGSQPDWLRRHGLLTADELRFSQTQDKEAHE